MPDQGLVLEASMLEARRENGFAIGLPALELGTGEVAALLGPSGCGKSTLLLSMLGLLRGVRCSGTLRFRGASVAAGDLDAWRPHLRGDITLVPQDARAALDPLQAIGTQIGTVTDRDQAACETALRELLVEEPARICRSYPHQVSGGQAQRALLAVALLRRPALLVADEPAASLDEGSVQELVHNLRLLREVHGTAILLSTHDRELARVLGARSFVHRSGQFLQETLASGEWPRRTPREPVMVKAEVLLECKNLCVSLDGHRIVRDVDLELRAGEIVAVVGPSGSGKTTLARALSGHLRPDSGWIGGVNHRVQMLFQEAYASLTPHRSILDLVREIAAPGFSILGEAMRLGLSPDRLLHTAGELSSGQRRRAALLRALSVEPKVLILDEPTASLDRDTASAVMRLVLDVQQQRQLACLLITHDRSLAEAVADEVVEMSEGTLC